MMRDFDKNPYTPCEKRIAEFFSEKGIGGGDDPVGFIIASHQALADDRRELRALVAKYDRTINEVIMDIALGAGGEFGG